MSSDRLQPPRDAAHVIDEATRAERRRCADVALLYPLEGFAYDVSNAGELLRLRDTISEAILKGFPIGERIK